MSPFTPRVLALTCFFALGGVLPPEQCRAQEAGELSPSLPRTASQEQIVAEALCVVIQSLQDFQKAAASGELEIIHTEELTLHAALDVLTRENSYVSPAQRESLKLSLSGLARMVAALHTSAHAADLPRTRAEVALAAETFETIELLYDSKILQRARGLADRYTCAMHATIEGKLYEPCPRCGMALDQRARPSPFEPGNLRMPARTIKGAIDLQSRLEPGHETRGILKLTTFSGEPVSPKDLHVTHTQRVHLLIVDPTLTDYHHEHPIGLDRPGEYAFSFTPRKPGTYRVWADLRPISTGFQEYVAVDIGDPASGETLPNRENRFSAAVDDLRFELLLAKPAILKAGYPLSAKVRVTTAAGKPCSSLEPLMATFAHLVGFNEDGKTVLHLHPKGPPVLDPQARGGPELDFTFYTSTPGFVRLFAQVQIGGRSIFAPFSLLVHPRNMPDDLCIPVQDTDR